MQHLDIQSEQLMAPRTLYHIVCGLAAELADGAVVFQLNVRDIGTAFAAVRALSPGIRLAQRVKHCLSDSRHCENSKVHWNWP